MTSGRVYIGIDAESRLGISLEPAGQGVFFLAVSDASMGPGGPDICKFVCPADQLDEVLRGESFEVSGKAGTCSVVPSGERVTIDFTDPDSGKHSGCTVSTVSFNRIFTLLKNRAYAT